MQMVCLHTVDPTRLSVDSTAYVGKGVVLNWLLNFLAHPHTQKNAIVLSLFCFFGFVGFFFLQDLLELHDSFIQYGKFLHASINHRVNYYCFINT